MNHFGLALSGGGFRATLYHLGVVRFLRDSGLLRDVTHITAVSGGSILGAHLALNWEKYCGTEAQFDEVASEIVRFAKLDVRNRILRRYPLSGAASMLLRMCGSRAGRRLSRPGLLEVYYEKHLYGDKCLFQLPKKPELHILATNLSEGCLCSFNREGLSMQSREEGRSTRFREIAAGLATIPMAVAASSAFPGFFPPFLLRGTDVGESEGEFDLQAFTDGGVFDNLGVRFFKMVEPAASRILDPFRLQEFLELEEIAIALRNAQDTEHTTPIGRLALLVGEQLEIPAPGDADWERRSDELLDALWTIVTTHALYRDSVFDRVSTKVDAAEELRNAVTVDERLSRVDHVWLNRLILRSTLDAVIGRPCIRGLIRGFDRVLVSDAGGKFEVLDEGSTGGLIKTALRASDILMDRVWSLEVENFEDRSGYTFASIADLIRPAEDPTAPHLEIQRQTARIRTDLDAFSNLEIRSLVRHGYCVVRQACLSEPEVYGRDLPDGPPWDPIPQDPQRRDALENDGAAIVAAARRLQHSSRRRVASTLFSLRDWPTYIWIPLLLFLFVGLPWSYFHAHRKATRNRMVVEAIADSNPMYRTILYFLERDPITALQGMPFEESSEPPPNDGLGNGVQVVRDARVIDLRGWTAEDEGEEQVHTYRSLRLRRLAGMVDSTTLTLRRYTRTPELSVQCENQRLHPKLIRYRQGDQYIWDLVLDLSRSPIGKEMDIVVEMLVPEGNSREGWLAFSVESETVLAKLWVLMPEKRSYDAFELISYERGKPETAEPEFPSNQLEIPTGDLIAFELVSPTLDRFYECHWTWSEP